MTFVLHSYEMTSLALSYQYSYNMKRERRKYRKILILKITRERIVVDKNSANSVADDVQLGVVAVAILASLDRHVLAHEFD